ncbi:MAG: hypothetical protein OJF49_000471 [Ktedonobacterales bacterium]|nr:MAG: hypothetical protein OJF49_000471 [Ktedonobacterales bacterium]
MSDQPDFAALAHHFDGTGIRAIVLMGSYARGAPGQYSDVDLVRFVEGDLASSALASGSFLIDDRLVVVSDTSSAAVETWFSNPDAAVKVIAGLRVGRALVDRDDYFAAIQERARAFAWDAAMQARADVWASQQMVGWIEEVHKGLAGIRTDDIGRMLNARFGLSWGLSRVMQTKRGVLLSSDNAFYGELITVMGSDSEWVRLRRDAFGIEDAHGHAPSLREQVIAGLHLYVVTAGLLTAALQPADAPLIAATVRRIHESLDGGA